MLLRSLHHWAGVPFNLDAMGRSMLVQASLSIFWSLLALCAMVGATRIRLRPLWLTGAGLLGWMAYRLSRQMAKPAAQSEQRDEMK